MAKTSVAMETANFIVTSLPDYVQENRNLIIRDVVLGTRGTIARIAKQTGIKKSAALNYLEIDPVLQNGTGCGFSAQGDIELTQRTIETGLIKINMDVCPEKLIGKWAEYLVKIGANRDELPFEQYIVDGIVKNIQNAMEKAVWQWADGTTGQYFDGLLEVLSDASAPTESIASGASAYAGVLQVYMALPEEVLNKGAEIYVSPAIYRVLLQEMVALNYFHYDPANGAPDEFMLPGTDAKVVKTLGLTGSLKIVGTYANNLYYGCDLESESEEVKIWFSDDDDVFKIKVKWNAGTQVAFPDLAVVGTFAAAPAFNAASVNMAASVAALADANHVFKTKEQE